MSKKTLLYYIYVLILFASCEKDQDAMLTQLEVMKEQFTPSYTSIAVECQLNTSASIKDVYVQYAASEKFADYQEIQMLKKDGKYHANIIDLEDNTIYYIRYSASNRYSNGTTKTISNIKTLGQSAPTINIISVNNILDESATAKFEIKYDGGAAITQAGICWSSNTNPTIDNSHAESKNQQTTIPISNLQANTTYYLRAYAVNRKGVGYSEQEISFTTLALPVVQTDEITDVQLTTALLNGNLIFNGNDTATILGFCWGKTPQPTISNNQKQVTTNSNNFAYQLSNLKDETKYYVRAYAKNKIGVAYGDEKAFTTNSAIKPTIATSSITDITYTSAKTGGNVTSDGGAVVTERGVCYSTSSNPTISNSKVSFGSGTGSFKANLTALLDGTTYYVRAYATNKKGTSYGEQKIFTTNAYLKPTVQTYSATNISYTSAILGGNVTSDGGTSVTERGVVYSTSATPTTSNSKKIEGSGTGSFSVNLTGLSNNTTYYVRAYAINKKGTNYGSQVSFTTVSYTTPNVTTTSANNISDITATVGGNITSDGGLSVTERGVVYSTSQNPTTASNKVSSGSGLGVFSVTLSNLQEGTTYYVRAFAKNSIGTSYGSQVSFTTKQFFLPEVTTSSVTNISYTSATICGNVTSDGGTAIIERGVVYSTTQNPTTSSSKMISESGTGTFYCNLTNLHNGTIYYARAYAVNKKGTSYGEQKLFTTNAYALPVVNTSSVSNVTAVNAVVGGNVISDGGASVIERGVCYAQSPLPTIANDKVSCGSGIGEYTYCLSNLTMNTQYYYRAYAQNTKGVSYGDVISFSTNTSPAILINSNRCYYNIVQGSFMGSYYNKTLYKFSINLNIINPADVTIDKVRFDFYGNSFNRNYTYKLNIIEYSNVYSISDSYDEINLITDSRLNFSIYKDHKFTVTEDPESVVYMRVCIILSNGTELWTETIEMSPVYNSSLQDDY